MPQVAEPASDLPKVWPVRSSPAHLSCSLPGPHRHTQPGPFTHAAEDKPGALEPPQCPRGRTAGLSPLSSSWVETNSLCFIFKDKKQELQSERGLILSRMGGTVTSSSGSTCSGWRAGRGSDCREAGGGMPPCELAAPGNPGPGEGWEEDRGLEAGGCSAGRCLLMGS